MVRAEEATLNELTFTSVPVDCGGDRAEEAELNAYVAEQQVYRENALRAFLVQPMC